jgi:hypothetical protein
MAAADYLAGVPAASRPLHGPPVTAAWDPTLHTHMQRLGVALYEEQVADQLVGDLCHA